MTNLNAHSSSSITYLKGQPITSRSVQDRAFHYGDGFFTTLLCLDNALLNWSAHWRRLEQSAQRLRFPEGTGWLDESTVLQQIGLSVFHFNQQLGLETSSYKVLKVLVSRGLPEPHQARGYAFSKEAKPLLLIQVSQQTEPLNFPPLMGLNQGLDEACYSMDIECCQTQACIQPQLAGVKHLNRLANVLARTEVLQKQQDEGIMLNALGFVIGGTQSNLFMIKGHQVITPKLDKSGVEGTTRYQLSSLLGSLGWEWLEADITLKWLQTADELFLSNAIRGIMPVRKLESKLFKVDNSLKIQEEWSKWQLRNALVLKREHLC